MRWSAGRCADGFTSQGTSEGVPGPPGRKPEVADAGAEPPPDPGADGRHDDVAIGDEGCTDPAHQIGGAVDPCETRVELLRRFEVVDQEQRLRSCAANVGAKAWPVPENLLAAPGAQ